MDYRKLIAFVLMTSPLMAEGPLFKHQDKYVNQEFVNAYQDIRKLDKAVALNTCGYVIGTIVQTVKVSDTAGTTSSGTSYTTTTTAGALSPKCSTDKIRIAVAGTLADTAFSTSNSYMSIFRGTTDLEGTGNGFVLISGNATNTVIQVPGTAVYLDSPSTTASTTYAVKIKSDTAAKAAWNGNGTGTMVIEDIAQ